MSWESLPRQLNRDLFHWTDCVFAKLSVFVSLKCASVPSSPVRLAVRSIVQADCHPFFLIFNYLRSTRQIPQTTTIWNYILRYRRVYFKPTTKFLNRLVLTALNVHIKSCSSQRTPLQSPPDSPLFWDTSNMQHMKSIPVSGEELPLI